MVITYETGYIDTDSTFANDSEHLVPSQKAVRAAIEAVSTSSISNGVNFYLTSTASGIATYDYMQKTPDSAGEVLETVSVTAGTSPLAFENYIADIPIGGTGTVDAGVWTFNWYTYTNNLLGTNTITFEIYSRTVGGVETLLFTVTSPSINNTTVQLHSIVTVQPSFSAGVTDSILLKTYASTTNVAAMDFTLVHSGTVHYSYINTPLILRHNDLAGLQGGTTGEEYHLTSAEHTEATQYASTSQPGLLTDTDWNTFNNKQPAGSYLTTVTSDSPLSGDGTSGSHLVIAQSNTTTDGYISSTDWNTFNNKQNALGFTPLTQQQIMARISIGF